MAEKKRKVTTAVVEAPNKKSKKTTSSTTVVETSAKTGKPTKVKVTEVVEAPAPNVVKHDGVISTSKKPRKRAADFLSDDEADAVTKPPTKISAPEAQKSKKSKKTKADASHSLTADGVNGVLEHDGDAKLETINSKKDDSKSLQAEATRTADKELEEEFGDAPNNADASSDADEDDVDADQGAALLAGFDSDTSDHAEDKGLDLSRTPALPQYKKTQKLLRKAKENPTEDGTGTVYIGRIPHGFYEQPMREYFAQFGEITRLRLSRNKRTGASKHFAFVEFKQKDVAKIVANTMDNYLMFGHILKCKFAPDETLHADVWKGANKKYRKIPHEKLERDALAAPKSEKYWDDKVSREQKKRDQKAKQLAALGLELPKSTLKPAKSAIEQRQLEDSNQEALKQIEAGSTTVKEPTGAIDPPPGVPKDTIALEKEKEKNGVQKSKSKKRKSDTAMADAPTDNVQATTATSKDEPAIPEKEDVVPAKQPKSKKRKSDTAIADAPTNTIQPAAAAPKEEHVAPEKEDVVPAKQPKSKKRKSDTAVADAPTGAVQPPPDVPKDEIALEKEEATTKQPKSKKRKSDTVAASEAPTGAVHPPPGIPKDEIALEKENTTEKQPKPSKKSKSKATAPAADAEPVVAVVAVVEAAPAEASPEAKKEVKAAAGKKAKKAAKVIEEAVAAPTVSSSPKEVKLPKGILKKTKGKA